MVQQDEAEKGQWKAEKERVNPTNMPQRTLQGMEKEYREERAPKGKRGR